MKEYTRSAMATPCALAAWLLAGCSGEAPIPLTSTGGTSQLGGTVNTGGVSNGGSGTSSGATTGGSVPIGGNSTTGGNAAIGGTSSTTGGSPAQTGGATATGGAEVGGSATGGKAAGGSSTGGIGGSSIGSTSSGGSSTEGTSTGGKATGGTPSVGGNASGGNATAGAPPAAGATGSEGCNGNAKPATSPSNGYLTIDVKGTSREYALVLPTGYDGKTPQPVMFAFHGTDSTAQGFMGSTGYGNVAKGAAGRVILVGPNGLARTGGMTGWLDMGGGGSEINVSDVDFFDALVAQLKVNYCVDPGRIFSMGHSAGGLISNYLGCVRGNVLRGIGPFAGWGPSTSAGGGATSAKCTGKVAAFIGHNPKEGEASECAKMSGGQCPWIVDWETLGWPSTQYWTKTDSCADIGAMPTAVLNGGNSTTGSPLPCKAFAGCDASYPVTLCLYDYADQWDGPHAFPAQWGAKAVTDFFLALPKVQ